MIRADQHADHISVQAICELNAFSQELARGAMHFLAQGLGHHPERSVRLRPGCARLDTRDLARPLPGAEEAVRQQMRGERPHHVVRGSPV
jgi:hypothetical protein